MASAMSSSGLKFNAKKGKKFTCGAPLIPEGLLNGGMKWKARLFFVFYGKHRVLPNAWEMKKGSNDLIP
jgi:hypothetical protein